MCKYHFYVLSLETGGPSLPGSYRLARLRLFWASLAVEHWMNEVILVSMPLEALHWMDEVRLFWVPLAVEYRKGDVLLILVPLAVEYWMGGVLLI